MSAIPKTTKKTNLDHFPKEVLRWFPYRFGCLEKWRIYRVDFTLQDPYEKLPERGIFIADLKDRMALVISRSLDYLDPKSKTQEVVNRRPDPHRLIYIYKDGKLVEGPKDLPILSEKQALSHLEAKMAQYDRIQLLSLQLKTGSCSDRDLEAEWKRITMDDAKSAQ